MQTPWLPVIAVVVVLACSKPAQAPTSTDAAVTSAVAFTQAFYDWYRLHDDRMATALVQKAAVFDPTLLSALRADIAAQAKNPSEIVGLDWDPFTNGQDPCNPYQVTDASRHGDTVVVAISGYCPDAAPRSRPDVIARLRSKDSTWVFVDFRDPADSVSLLGHLALLRKGRESNARR